MAKVTKEITVTGECKNCGRQNVSSVRASGKSGTSGDWIGKGTCGQCGSRITLTKKNIKF